MGGGGGKSFKPVSYTPPQPPEVENYYKEEVQETGATREKARKAAALANGRKSTLLTGALGDTSSVPVLQKNLLGQ